MLNVLIKIGLGLLFLSIYFSSSRELTNSLILGLLILFAFKLDVIDDALKIFQKKPDRIPDIKKYDKPSDVKAAESSLNDDELFKQRMQMKYGNAKQANAGVSIKSKSNEPDSFYKEKLPEQDSIAVAWLREKFLTGNPMTKIGMLILFIGMAFFIKYATDHHLLVLSIELRHVIVALSGVLITLIGVKLAPTNKIYGNILSGGGVGLMYMTVYSAFNVFHLLAPLPAFVCLLVIVLVSGLIAVTQDAKYLAIFGVLGGFLAPILVSSGHNDYVALFSYYLVLNTVILGVAFFKSWRELNYLGFVFTYIISALWGYGSYQPENFSKVEPFLILFFLFYALIVILHALHKPNDLNRIANIGLALANPIVAFSLQSGLVYRYEYGIAISALVLCGFYGMLAGGVYWSRNAGLRHLFDPFIALSVMFGTLTIPFTFTRLWSQTDWAIESVALLWVGIRQQNAKLQAASAIVIIASLLLFMTGMAEEGHGNILFSSYYLSGITIAVAFLVNSYQFYLLRRSDLTLSLSQLFFIIGCVGWYYISLQQIYDVLKPEMFIENSLIFVASSSLIAGLLASVLSWPWLSSVALLLLPAMIICSLPDSLNYTEHTRQYYFVWLYSFASLYTIYYLQEKMVESIISASHFFAFIFLIWWAGDRAVLYLDHYYPEHLYFQLMAGGLIPAVMLLFVTYAKPLLQWPIAKYEESYRVMGAGVLVCYFAVWFAATVCYAGEQTQLFSLPLLNPIDGTIALVLAAIVLWMMNIRVIGRDVIRILLLFCFVWLNTMLLRSLHYWLNIDYEWTVLWNSITVQAALSICWSMTALVLTTVASRMRSRVLWFAGSLLMFVVVCKLFLVDLSDSNTLERIITFVGVGILMLINGYVSPLPPKD